jgi:hypothetical protein
MLFEHCPSHIVLWALLQVVALIKRNSSDEYHVAIQILSRTGSNIPPISA